MHFIEISLSKQPKNFYFAFLSKKKKKKHISTEIPGARCIDWLEWRKDQGIKWSGISFLKDWFNVTPLDKSLNNKLVVQKALKVCMIASTFWFGLSTIII